jgi:hypothetical protein
MLYREIVLGIVATVIAVTRVLGVKHPTYPAVAHLFVGGLAAAWLTERERIYSGLFIILCVVEVVCFFAGILP